MAPNDLYIPCTCGNGVVESDDGNTNSFTDEECDDGNSNDNDGCTNCILDHPFIITVQTDNPGSSSSDQFTIPTLGGGYDYNVDCDNDGILEVTGANGDYTCHYGLAGTYTIKIYDNV